MPRGSIPAQRAIHHAVHAPLTFSPWAPILPLHQVLEAWHQGLGAWLWLAQRFTQPGMFPGVHEARVRSSAS